MLAYYSHLIAIQMVKWFPVIASASAGDHGGDGEHGGGHGDDHGGGTHLPNFFAMIFGKSLDSAYFDVNIFFAFGTAILLSVIALAVYKKREMIPAPFQNGVEFAVESMYNFIQSILGKDARKYTPFLGTLFFYILINNWLGMIPGGHSPSTSLNITASLAVLVFGYAQWVGIRRLGLGGYIHHLAGSPNDVVSYCMIPLMLPLHIIGELAKPMSLALRLFGNISGEDTLIAVFVGFGIAMLAFSPVGIPIQLPFYFLGLLLSSVQALVFTLLSTIYILLMLPHEAH